VSGVKINPTTGSAGTRVTRPADTWRETIHPESCTGYMPTPWIALYRELNWAGQTHICFLGRGKVDLSTYQWAHQASAVNVGARAVLTDDQGNRFNILPGRNFPDLNKLGWNDRATHLEILGWP
jgi:hypothetical protein